MRRLHLIIVALCSLAILASEGEEMRAQQEVGFLEHFATSSDRRAALRELIPGTEDYYYFHCLHFQNEKQLAQAQAILDQWKARFGDNGNVQRMQARQMLLGYETSPEATLKFLRERMGLQLEHAPPNRDRAAALASQLNPDQLAADRLIEAALARDPGLNQIATFTLPQLVGRPMPPDQLRAWLKRLDRADFEGLVKRLAEELALADSPGFGWATVHQLLTLEQLDQLLKLRPNLIGHEPFLRTYLARLAPPDYVDANDGKAQRAYLERLAKFVRTLPASQNSLKALVLGNLLRLNLREGKYDRNLFLEYLALPRQAVYYAKERIENQPVILADLNFAMNPQVTLPPVGNDLALIQRYLEHFFQSESKLDDFARYLDRAYLERVLAETKILYGAENADTWYAKLNPNEQKALRERVELRFAPGNRVQYAAEDTVQLAVELKNVPKLLIKIYQINPRNFYRTFGKQLSTDVDLDGLVSNAERQFEFSQAADRRHNETIELEQLQGRGVWVVDLLGGGQRSRALVQKGGLSSVQALTDLGHLLRVYDDRGELIKSAHAEIGNQSFEADSQGRILIPYVESEKTQNVLLVDDDFAVQETLLLRSEGYELQARFVIDRQALVAGTITSLLIRAQLQCAGRPASIQLLEKPQLTIVATDMDGLSTTQTTGGLQLSDSGDVVHKFLVPQRLARIEFRLSGRVYNQSKDERQEVSASQTIDCNQNLQTNLIGSFYLQPSNQGYRLMALGRNGEPLAKLPVSLAVNTLDVTSAENFTLATDASGSVDLGPLPRVTSLTASAQGVQPAVFEIDRSIRQWPSQIHQSSRQRLVLPLGTDAVDASNFSLTEMVRGVPLRNLNHQIQSGDGALRIDPLAAGNYVLRDHRTGGVTSIAVVEGLSESEQYVIGATRAVELSQRQALVIEQATLAEKEIRIRLEGADAHTRVHIVATPLLPALAPVDQARLPYPGLMEWHRRRPSSFYVDSLKLDEEYSYILQRQQATKYPGNLLAQPSLLVHPWELALTENASRQAQAGDAMPQRADAAMAAPPGAAPAQQAGVTTGQASVSYDFLSEGTLVAGNLRPDEKGEVIVPRAPLDGYTSLTVLAVHPTTMDSRTVLLPRSELKKRDLRLKNSFDPERHLTETQSVRLLKAGEKVAVGDARTSRVQVYATIADVFRLYGTLLKNPEWEKFRFLTNWPELSDEEKRARYSEMSCHELDYFLYRKDKKFFDAVVAPLISQKLDKQLVDLWLLDKPIDAFGALWRIERLNTLERILLARRLGAAAPGTRRWLDEYLAAHPLDPLARSLRFETALRGTLLDGSPNHFGLIRRGGVEFDAFLGDRALGEPLPAAAMAMGGMGGAGGMPADKLNRLEEAVEEEALRAKRGGAVPEAEAKFYFKSERFGVDAARRGRARFFQSLDQTREWAETQYHRVRLDNQTQELVPPSPFWQEFLKSDGESAFLSENVDLPTSNLNEGLLALAVIDLPWQSEAAEMNVENDKLVVTSRQAAIAYVQSIEAAEASQGAPSILVGQDIYLAEPHTDEESNRPLEDKPLLIGVPYRASVVVTNPSSVSKRVQVLYQLPQGAMPLAASRVTRSTPVELNPYSTAQVQYVFYFPGPGQFQHYGSQVSGNGQHLVHTESMTLRVLAEPESVDETAWSYIADWGSNEAVLAYLRKANLQRLDLSRIAFRMQDKGFYAQVLELLTDSQRFDADLWAYAVRHNDPANIEQLLQNRRDFTAQIGPAIDSPLLQLDPRQQMTYEHLDYRPLVVARIHPLGDKRLVLNDKLFAQYSRLLNVMAHQPHISDEQRMEMCYYALIQNRIQEALDWFEQVDVERLATRMQYDYFDAYLDFFRGRYERATQIAGRYASYPVSRWRELFAEIGEQVKQRTALVTGQELTSVTALDSGLERQDRILTDRREAQQNRQAAESPALDLVVADGVASVEYRNLERLQINYYLMDIELLFSRNPFVAQGGNQLPAIQANVSETLDLASGAAGSRKLELPPAVRNRNLMIEVSARGISRSAVLTANSLAVTVSEPYGRLQVRSQTDRSPVEAAYVKVYARHRDGSVRFYKDGYTDLRGQFDYVTLSTSDLSTVERLSILVIDAQRGAIVREANPPTR